MNAMEYAIANPIQTVAGFQIPLRSLNGSRRSDHWFRSGSWAKNARIFSYRTIRFGLLA